MGFNPDKHHRRSIRLPHHDYSGGWYFVTICTDQRSPIFGHILRQQMQLSPFGQIATNFWTSIPEHFERVRLSDFVVMPNHVHGIVAIAPRQDTAQPTGERRLMAGSLGAIVGSYKSAVTKQINLLRNAPGKPVWQRNYYEIRIRNPESLKRIQIYIRNNPRRWEQDRLRPGSSPKP